MTAHFEQVPPPKVGEIKRLRDRLITKETPRRTAEDVIAYVLSHRRVDAANAKAIASEVIEELRTTGSRSPRSPYRGPRRTRSVRS